VEHGQPRDSASHVSGRRALALAATAIFLVIAPGTVAAWIPWWITGWQMRSLPAPLEPLRWLGIPLIAIGVLVLLDSFARFAWQGLGAPAPVLPTRKLIITGLYRYVRNPMYVAVVSIVLGQAMVFANVEALVYGTVLWLGFHLFVLVYEEPTLRRSFPADYASFVANVPRWIPRVRPWKS
jgi:protein-S-isoprenylcysteine O-methyltransferase Ste14